MNTDQEKVRQFWHSVECDPGCANCCSKSCRHLDNHMMCEVHPTKLDVSPQEAEIKHNRGMGCAAPPIELFVNGVYCPPVVKLLEEMGDLKIKHKIGSKGVVMIVDYSEVMSKTRRLRGLDD